MRGVEKVIQKVATSGAMELEVGQTANVRREVTEADLELYADLSGHRSPLHFDETYAGDTRFGQPIVPCGILVAIIETLVEGELAGPGTVLLHHRVDLRHPAHVGDVLMARARVLSTHPTKPVARIALQMENESGDRVLEGECWVYQAVEGGA